MKRLHSFGRADRRPCPHRDQRAPETRFATESAPEPDGGLVPLYALPDTLLNVLITIPDRLLMPPATKSVLLDEFAHRHGFSINAPSESALRMVQLHPTLFRHVLACLDRSGAREVVRSVTHSPDEDS
jgi:hypothetical protein